MKLLITVMAFSYCAAVFADEGLIGWYSGHYKKFGRMDEIPMGFTLAITAAENGALRAEAHRMTRSYICAGPYQLKGTYEQGGIRLTSVGSPGARVDCRVFLRLRVQGDTLQGKFNSTTDIVLHKQRAPLPAVAHSD